VSGRHTLTTEPVGIALQLRAAVRQHGREATGGVIAVTQPLSASFTSREVPRGVVVEPGKGDTVRQLVGRRRRAPVQGDWATELWTRIAHGGSVAVPVVLVHLFSARRVGGALADRLQPAYEIVGVAGAPTGPKAPRMRLDYVVYRGARVIAERTVESGPGGNLGQT
jgi:hypothetical protein